MKCKDPKCTIEHMSVKEFKEWLTKNEIADDAILFSTTSLASPTLIADPAGAADAILGFYYNPAKNSISLENFVLTPEQEKAHNEHYKKKLT